MTDPGAAIAAACHDRGLDVSARLQVGWYNAGIARAHRLPDYRDAESEVVLIGNTRALWPAFVTALKNDKSLLRHPNPLDHFTETVVNQACAQAGIETQVRWAHRAEPAHISFQKLAEVSGLAWRSAAALSVHPVYGPWIALRAAVVLPRHGPSRPGHRLRPCRHCAGGCKAVFARTCANPSATWRDWLAVRDACPTGREYRYSRHQVRYHYTKAREALIAALPPD